MRKTISWLCTLALLASCLLLFTACTGDDGTGRIFAFPLDAAPRHLDPAVAQTPDELLIVNNIFEGLVRQDADGTIIPGVAYRWELSPDGETFVFHLRQNSHWALGTEATRLLGDAAEDFDTQVTAYDFAFALTRALLPETNAPSAAALFSIRNARAVHAGEISPDALGIEALGRFVLSISLEAPSAGFLYALTQSVAMPVHPDFFQATRGRFGLTAQHTLSNGPFYLNRWAGNLLRLRQNEGYAGHASVAPAGVNLFVQPNPASRLATFGHDGGYDAAFLPAAWEAQVPADAELTRLYNATLAMLFHSNQDAYLRQALFAALDMPALGIAPPGLLPASVRVGGDDYSALVQPPAPATSDAARAQQLLDQSGPGRMTLTLICLPGHDPLARQMLQQWQQAFGLRVTVTIETIENPEELAQRVQNGNFDIAITTLQANSSFALQTIEDWTTGPGNFTRYASDQLSQLLDTARAAITPLAIAQALRAVEFYLMQHGLILPLEPQANLLVVAPGVTGFALSPTGDRVFFGDMRK